MGHDIVSPFTIKMWALEPVKIKRLKKINIKIGKLAETEGFEPSVPFWSTLI
jgi:hypothetical protein